MNREDIIRMARSAGAKPGIENEADMEFLERFAALAFAAGAAAEREACAKVCDDYPHGAGLTEKQLAQAIRARGETK